MMLASERQVSPSTHRQALSAILYLYKEVLKIELPWMQEIGRPKEQQRLPVVLTALEVRKTLNLLDATNPVFGLFAKLLYGTGMRMRIIKNPEPVRAFYCMLTFNGAHGAPTPSRLCRAEKFDSRDAELGVKRSNTSVLRGFTTTLCARQLNLSVWHITYCDDTAHPPQTAP